MYTSKEELGQVLSCAPGGIIVEISDLKTFEAHKQDLQVGRYLKIAQGNNDFTIAIITNIKGVNVLTEVDGKEQIKWTFQIECQAVGALDSDGGFQRGSVLLPVPTEPAYPIEKEILAKLFQGGDQYDLPFGALSMNREIQVHIDGDRFFGKHIGVAGSIWGASSFSTEGSPGDSTSQSDAFSAKGEAC